MNILIINHYAGSPFLGMEYRPHYLATEWIKSGHKVRIIASSESHVRFRKVNISEGLTPYVESGVEYRFIKTPAYSGNNLGRAVNIFSFVASLYLQHPLALSDFKPDVVIASSTYPLDIFPARFISRRFGAKLYFELHDLWPLTLVEIGGMSPVHPFVRIMAMAERYYCRHVRAVVSLLPLAHAYLISHGLSDDKFFYVPNGIKANEWDSSLKLASDFQARIDSFQKKYSYLVGYAGGHGPANWLSVLLDAAEFNELSDVGFVLVGQGSQKAILQEKAMARNLQNVLFLDPVEKSVLPSLLNQFDMLYIGMGNKSIYKYGISPNKLFDYMMSGRPIISAIQVGSSIIDNARCGINCSTDDVGSIVRGIRQVVSLSEEERSAMGNNGREYVLARHTYESLASQFLEILNDQGNA